MPVRRIAILSVHTSPLAQPGTGDGGGMNVYVRSLAASLARAGVECDVLTRAERPGLPAIVEVEPGFRVLHLEVASSAPVTKHELPRLIDPLTDASLAVLAPGEYDVLHANYWISGAVGHRLKHELGLPLVATFHTLDRVKAEAGVDDDDPRERARVESETINCSDLLLASTDEERSQLHALYGAVPERIEIVPPGVDHEVFSPGDRARARGALGVDARHLLLFVGRLQPLKGAELALRCLAQLEDHDAQLLVVGGPSGSEGPAEVDRLHRLADALDLRKRVQFVEPQPHGALTTYYRAADVCLVPSRSESFGLVALEAAACGTPVVAAAVGGLRSLVRDGETGFLVDGRDPLGYAAPVALLLDEPELATAMGERAERESRGYAWSTTAARLRRLYVDLAARALVECR